MISIINGHKLRGGSYHLQSVKAPLEKWKLPFAKRKGSIGEVEVTICEKGNPSTVRSDSSLRFILTRGQEK